MQTGFRGWWVVAVAFLAQFVSLGLTMIVYPLFAQPIQADFSVSMTEFNLVGVPFNVVMTLAGPIVGPLLDRRSIRGVMVSGALLLAASLALMSFATAAWQLGVVYGVGAALSVTLLGPLPATTVAAKWFERQRGRAMAIVSLGPLAAGLILSLLTGVLIESVGWRTTLRWFALGALGVVPMIWLVIRNRPEDIGQRPDGAPVGAGDAGHAGADPAWSARALLSTRSFWVLAFAVGIVFGFLQAWQVNVGKYAQDLGYGSQEQSYLLVAGATLGIPGILLFGWLAERRDPRLLLWIAIAVQLVAFAVLRSRPEQMPVVLAASGAVGCTAGALTPLYAALLARIFGPASFGTAMGLAGLVMLPFASAAALALGQLRDATGNYDSGLLLLIVAFVVGAGILGLLPRREGAPAPAATAA